MPSGFRQEYFYVFPIKTYGKHVNPERDHFWVLGHNFNKLSRRLLGYATYQISRLYTLD